MKAISQIEERLIQLSVDEQLQLISRMAQRLRDQLYNSIQLDMPLGAVIADEKIQREVRPVEPAITSTEPNGWGDKLTCYRKIAQHIVQLYASWSPRNDDSRQVVIDVKRDHYILMNIGWKEDQRVYHTVVHFDIINDKFWVQADRTNRPVADALLEAGVPREDIVLGFHPPEVRQYTDFAAA